MKIIEKILYVLAALLALVFLFMLLCMVNPQVHEKVSELVDKVTEKDAQKTSVPEDSANYTFSIPEATEQEETKQYTRPEQKTYEEYVEKWTGDGIDDEYRNNDTYDDFVTAFTEGFIEGLTGDEEYDEDELRKAYEESNESRADYQIPETEVKIVENEEEATEVVKDTDVGETGENEEFDPLFYPYYNILNSKGKRLYKQIYANAVALNESFLPVEDATGSEWDTAMFSVIYDHPELFWVDNTIYTQYDYNGKIIKLHFYYYDEIPDIPAAQRKFEAKAQEMIAGAKDLETDFEKEKYIHDLLGNKLTYDWAELNQSAYSAIVYDKTVCAGYSKGFQYLMQQLEIPTYTCVGWGGFGILFGGMHGWNIIKLEADYYNVDCTWDDDEPISYEYFNLCDDDNYMHTRMFNSIYLPPCNGSKYSGLVKRTMSDYGLGEDDVIDNMEDYYAYCKDKALNESSVYDENSYECDFGVVISKELYTQWKKEYESGDFYDEYLNDVIATLGESKKYNFFMPIGLVLCEEEELDDGSYLITHSIYMGYVGTN
ncbi:transglutaminase domain-containing protein [Butyrivibrio hungatei]|uniref:Transglutaminase-like superfamily protein n=1 Tax=Butyrivibrio hungatei TaxID=185008 RepID=A0A1D9NYI8_9FIRM|nr:hypothetical protein [Butyrivibrio hungatei]AOZ95340.1 hypothetical protein bhn_I0306 [Butyrivibrio hungatei]